MRSLSLTLGTLVVAVVAAAPSKATFPGDDGRIAFRRYLDKAQTRGAIFTVARDGTGERQLTRPASGVVDDQPDWSPDGSRLVFTRCLRNSACAAYTVRADGSGLAKVSPACRPASRCGGDQSAAFAPDGRRVAFSRFDTRYGCCAIVTTDLRGGHLTVVTKGRKPLRHRRAAVLARRQADRLRRGRTAAGAAARDLRRQRRRHRPAPRDAVEPERG